MKMFVEDIKRNIISRNFVIGLVIFLLSASVNMLFNVFWGNGIVIGSLNVFLFSTTFGTNVLTYTAPLIAALAGGMNYLYSIKNEFIKHEMLINKKNYFWSKILSSFFSGGLVFLAGGILTLLMAFIFDPSPSLRLIPTSYLQSFRPTYATSLLTYCIIVILNMVLFGGTYSLLSMGFSAISKNRYVTILSPVLLYVFSTILIGSFYNIGIIKILLPCLTLSLSSISEASILFDHIKVSVIGIVLFLIGYRKNMNNI